MSGGGDLSSPPDRPLVSFLSTPLSTFSGAQV